MFLETHITERQMAEKYLELVCQEIANTLARLAELEKHKAECAAALGIKTE